MAAPEPFRLCVDLNVWISSFLADANGLRGTPSQQIVETVQDGRSNLGPVQLIVSHTMLTRLHDVLLRKGASLDTATQFISLIELFSRLGPTAEFPHVVLGGGVLSTGDARSRSYDPYDLTTAVPVDDPEDGRVIDAAVAGRAHALVTANFRDFRDRHDTIILEDRIHIRHTAMHDVVIIRPLEMAHWLRTGGPPAVRS